MKGLDSSSGQSIDPRGHGKKKERPEWIKNLSRYDKPNTWLAIEQLVGTFVRVPPRHKNPCDHN
jgi:hypothetical protein